MYDTSACFGSQRPSSGRWLSKEKVVMANYVRGFAEIKLRYM